MALPERAGELLLLHNPGCSKSRAAEAWLRERGVRFGLRRYLEDPLSRSELAELRKRLARPVREWTRTGEAAFRALGLPPQPGDEALLDAIAREAILLERPILVSAERAVVGRPVESLIALLP